MLNENTLISEHIPLAASNAKQATVFGNRYMYGNSHLRDTASERKSLLLFAVPLISRSFKRIIQKKTKQKSGSSHPGLNIHAVRLALLFTPTASMLAAL